ncbi:ATG8-interacting protein 2-like isoform X2 [Zingiber officinale]|uniref:ATG8-interacting protein 2-like isoform X2 n=1 Tax=Zingiber officinale TaxID=94328 RepID=UPI001C4A99A9|nr:ATG8-interacting protein 2-like isoform X2 [Zingiber officinale]
MADDEKVGEEGTSRGADWEVVSLTASTYAAAPSPLEVDPAGESEVMESTESKDDLHGVEFFDEGKRVSVHEMGLEEAKGPQKSTLVGMEQSVLADPDSIASHSGTHRSNIKFKTNESFDVNTDSSREHKIDDEDESSGPELPSQAWWKRHVASVYHQAKEANTFWSVIVAAAVVGIIVIGRRWQQDKWKLAITDEKMSRMLKPVGRFKNVLLGGHQPSKGIH